jgi:hypothetical protein
LLGQANTGPHNPNNRGIASVKKMLKFVWNFIFKLTGSDISFSVCYYNWDFFLIELPADYKGIEGILARRKLIPLKDAGGNARIQIAGCDMKDVQIVGPYYEISVQAPVEALEGSEHAHYTHPICLLPQNRQGGRELIYHDSQNSFHG